MICDDKLDRVIDCLVRGLPRSKALLACGADYKDWLDWQDAHGARLQEAERIGGDTLADSLLDIHETLDNASARLASDNIKWLLSKRQRSTYGEKVEIKQTYDIDIRGILEAAQERAMLTVNSVRLDDVQPNQSLVDSLINEL